MGPGRRLQQAPPVLFSSRNHPVPARSTEAPAARGPPTRAKRSFHRRCSLHSLIDTALRVIAAPAAASGPWVGWWGGGTVRSSRRTPQTALHPCLCHINGLALLLPSLQSW